MTAKLSYEKVKELIELEGYILVSPEYVNSGSKLDLNCPKGHLYSVTLNNFVSKKHRCSICSGKTVYTLEIVSKIFEEIGYRLLTKNYKNMHQKLSTICDKGHPYLTSLGNFIFNESRCFECTGIKRYTLEEISKILKEEEFILLTDHYRNARQKLEVICPKGHNTDLTMNGFLSQESRCRYCAHNKDLTIDFIKETVEKEGYRLISEQYIPSEKIKLLCPNNHPYETSIYNFKNHDRRCPDCISHGSSNSQRELTEWIQQFYPNAIKYKNYYDSKNKKKFLELDVYIEELHVGIEMNGLIWHSEKFKENKNYHANKTKLANSMGIRVLHIFEDEWINRKKQVKNFLLSVMNQSERRVGARKTELRIVDKKEASIFLDENHIQGDVRAEISLGLYYKEELVAVMAGGKHHRQGIKDCFILNRLAFKSGISVSGGSSKLLKSLIVYAKSKGFSKLVSWSDNRWSEGRVYEKLGFVLEANMRPDYSYFKKDKRISKQSCQKKQLAKRGGIGSTEREMAISLKLYRVWDCGKKRWTMDL